MFLKRPIPRRISKSSEVLGPFFFLLEFLRHEHLIEHSQSTKVLKPFEKGPNTPLDFKIRRGIGLLRNIEKRQKFAQLAKIKRASTILRISQIAIHALHAPATHTHTHTHKPCALHRRS